MGCSSFGCRQRFGGSLNGGFGWFDNGVRCFQAAFVCPRRGVVVIIGSLNGLFGAFRLLGGGFVRFKNPTYGLFGGSLGGFFFDAFRLLFGRNGLGGCGGIGSMIVCGGSLKVLLLFGGFVFFRLLGGGVVGFKNPTYGSAVVGFGNVGCRDFVGGGIGIRGSLKTVFRLPCRFGGIAGGRLGGSLKPVFRTFRLLWAFRLPCGCGGQGRRSAGAFDTAVGGDGFGGKGGEGEHAQQSHHEAGVFVGRQRQVAAAVQQALVVKLDLFAAELLGKGGQSGVFGIAAVGGLRYGLQ